MRRRWGGDGHGSSRSCRRFPGNWCFCGGHQAPDAQPPVLDAERRMSGTTLDTVKGVGFIGTRCRRLPWVGFDEYLCVSW